MEKVCSRCELTKPITEFHKQGKGTKARCKDCIRQINLKYYPRGEKYHLSIQGLKRCTKCKNIYSIDNFYKNGKSNQTNKQKLDPCCKDCKRILVESSRRDRQYKKLYNISLEDYNTLLIKQGNKCAICFKLNNGLRFFAVDHNHDTGFVRGLLCDPCNRGIGLLGDSLFNLENAVNYIKEVTKMEDDFMEIRNLGLVPTEYGFLNIETGEKLDHNGVPIEEDTKET